MTVKHFMHRFSKALRIPAAFAVCLTVYVYLADGGAGERFGLPIKVVASIYFGSALGIAAIIALCGAWAQSRFRAVVLGFLGGMVFALVLNFTVIPRLLPAPLFGFQLLFVMVMAGLFPGAFVGGLFWEANPDDQIP